MCIAVKTRDSEMIRVPKIQSWGAKPLQSFLNFHTVAIAKRKASYRDSVINDST